MMYVRGLFVLFIFRGYLCIRLPGLYDDDSPIGIEDGSSAYIPFSDTRNIGTIDQPVFKDSISETLYDVFTRKPEGVSVTSTTTTPPDKEYAKETTMEQLLDKIFGNKGWRSLLQNYKAETTRKQTVSENTHSTAFMGLTQGSGFLSNQISADNLFNHDENGKTHPTLMPKMTHKEDNSGILNKGSVKGHLKVGLKYTGSFVNTNLHSYNNEETTNRSPSSATINNPATLPPPHVSNIKTNWEQGPFGQRQNGNNAFSTDMFDPNSVNNILTSYNPYGNSAVFATQTGSNPLNMNLRVNFDADKINANYMEKNSEHTMNSLPPGVVSLPTGAGGRVSNEFTNHLPQFDANKVNENLLDRNLVYSDKPANVMAPAFLTGNVNRQVSRVNQAVKSDVLGQQNVVQGTTSEVQAEKNKEDYHKIVASTEVSRESSPQFNFIPGNLYPGVSQDHDNQQSQVYSPSIAMPVFDPNSVNSQQVRFNPNSISWIQKRDVLNRSIDERKLNGNRSVQSKDSFGKSNSFFTGNASDPIRNGDVKGLDNTSAKDSFGSSQQVTQGPPPIQAGNSQYPDFNPNKLNTEQGQRNFIPGQMSPYDPSPGQYLTGKTGISTFYRPNNTSAKLLNFDIGSLLGIGKGNSTGGLGFTDAFNPTSLNRMMMSTFSENLGNTLGDNATNVQSFGTSYNPNTSQLSGFNGVGGNTNFGFGFDLSNNSSKFSHNFINDSGFMKGGFDPNAANVGFGDILNGGESSGFGLGASSNTTSSSSEFGGFGTIDGFDPNAANVGFGATNYGMGGLSGPVGAFGGSFNADTMNAGLLGRSNSTAVKDLLSYFLGAKMKVEGGLTNHGEGGLFDSRYVGTFDPDSVNHVSYDPNKYNNVKIHFNPSEMLGRNPGMDKDTIENIGKLFDPDKVNSHLLQQSFNPGAMLQYIPGVDDKEIAQQTGNRNEGSKNNQDLFDPFETMKKLMEASISFIPGNFAPDTTARSSVMSTADRIAFGNSNNASLFGNAPTQTPTTNFSTINNLSTNVPVVTLTTTDGIVSSTAYKSTTSSPAPAENSTTINT